MHRLLCWSMGAAAIVLLESGDAALTGEPAGPKPYRVIEGAVDPRTYNGYRRYHATCSHCHGPDGMGGSFARSLIDRPIPFDSFVELVRVGVKRGNTLMQGFADDPNVEPHIEDIYIYLRARADGALGRGRPRRLE